MATHFVTDPHEMRRMAGRFAMHAQTVEDAAHKMWAGSSMNIAGVGSRSSQAPASSHDTMGQVNQGLGTIVNMMAETWAPQRGVVVVGEAAVRSAVLARRCGGFGGER